MSEMELRPETQALKDHLVAQSADPHSGFSSRERALFSLITLPRAAQAICTDAERGQVIDAVTAAIDAAVQAALARGDQP